MRRPNMSVAANIKMAKVIATVTRRDEHGNVIGVEELGVLTYYHKNPFKMFAWRLKRFIQKLYTRKPGW